MKYLNSPSYKEVLSITLFYIIFGLLLCFFNIHILTIATRIFGILLLLFGGFRLYQYFGKRETDHASLLLAGIISLFMGSWMALSPSGVISILPVLTGFIIIFTSLIQFQKSLVLKDLGLRYWYISLFFSILGIIAGCIVFFKPIQTLSFILQLLGIFFIVEGILIFINERYIQKLK